MIDAGFIAGFLVGFCASWLVYVVLSWLEERRVERVELDEAWVRFEQSTIRDAYTRQPWRVP